MASQILDYLSKSNDIRFDLVTLNYQSQILGSGTANASNLCPTKSGGLKFSLNASKLGVSQLNGLNYEIVFTGVDNGFDGSGQQLIKWSVNQQNISQAIPGTPATLDSIQGQFVTSLSPINPEVLSTNCQGVSLFFGAVIQTPDESGQINLKGHAPNPLPLQPDVQIEVNSSIAISGVVGAPHDLAVKILNQGVYCGNPVIVGGEATSSAYLSGVPGGVTPTYKWTVGNGAIVGPDDQWKVRYTLPNLNAINISVTVTAGDQVATAKTVVYAITEGIAQLEQLLCSLRTTALINIWFNPLIDPVTSNIRSRFSSPTEVRNLVQLAKQIERLSHQIQQLGSELIQGEKH